MPQAAGDASLPSGGGGAAANLRHRFSGLRYRRQVTALFTLAGVMLAYAGLAVLLAPEAGAQLDVRALPSDPRATFHDGNAVSCGDLGLGSGTIQMGSSSNTSA